MPASNLRDTSCVSLFVRPHAACGCNKRNDKPWLIAQVKVFTQEDVKGWFTSIDRGSQTQKKLSFLLRCTLKHALLKDLSNGDKLAC